MVIRNNQSNQSWKISDDSVMYWDNYGNIKYQNLEPNELFRLPKKGSMMPDDKSNFIQVRMGGGVIRWVNRNLKPKSPKPNTKAQELIKQKKKEGTSVLKRDLDYNNEFFRKLIKGKRVIYVGPATTLEGKEMGEFIDSFDVVIRSNNSYQIPDESQVDYGSRCDILYASGVFRKQNIINSENTEHIKLVCSNRKFHSVIDKCRVFRMDRIKKQKRFLTGIYSLIDILNQNPRELYITGMDFYQSEKMYTDFYKIGDLHEDDNAKKTLNTYHDVDKDLEYFKKHIAYKHNVTLDEMLKHLMSKESLYETFNTNQLGFFKDKKVCLIGSGKITHDIIFKNYDIIVGVNQIYKTGFFENIDVLFHGASVCDPEFIHKMHEISESKKIVLLPRITKGNKARIQTILGSISKNANILYLNISSIENEMDSNPLSGVSSLYYIIRDIPKSIDIYGFNFYTAEYMEGMEVYANHPNKNKKIHDLEKNKEYFNKLITKNNNIKWIK